MLQPSTMSSGSITPPELNISECSSDLEDDGTRRVIEDPGGGGDVASCSGPVKEHISLEPSTPADDLTEQQGPPQYQPRKAAWDDREAAWIMDKIKMKSEEESQDAIDAKALDNAGTAMARQISAVSVHRVGREQAAVNTNAFGQIVFAADTPAEDMSWFLRLDVKTEKDLLQELFETKFEIINSAKPLRIHFIDYDQAERSIPEYVEDDYQPRRFQHSCPNRDANQKIEMQRVKMDPLSERLYKDIRSICKKTVGVVLTWSGLVYGPGRYIHEALEALHTERSVDALNLVSVAFPPWSILPKAVRRKLVDCTSKSEAADVPPRFGEEECLGSGISPSVTHYLLLDDGQQEVSSWVDDCMIRDTSRLPGCRHFQYELMKAMENCKETAEMPVVCVLMGGGDDSLKMVKFALDKKIPVLVVKGTGGVADMIATVYLKADLESEKYRDKQKKVRSRTVRLPGVVGQHYLDKYPCGNKGDMGYASRRRNITFLLDYIFQRLDYLTIYCPTLTVQSLDSTIFEALLKNEQETRIKSLMKVMRRVKSFRLSTSTSDSGAFIDSETMQMDFFIEAIRQNSVDIVKLMLDTLHISLSQHFHMGRILRLYTRNVYTVMRMIDVRNELQELLKKMVVFPLRCLCEGCCSCAVDTNTTSPESELQVQRTCLHPAQELFLWSVYSRQIDLAVIFWRRCDDKIAAALVAHAVLRSLAKSKEDPDFKWQIEEDTKLFQHLALQTLRSCHEMDEILTESLLTKPCPWWGGLSVLQIAITTENRALMAHSACKNIMTRIWRGDFPRDPPPFYKGPCRLVDAVRSNEDCTCKKVFWHPRRKYAVNLVLQVAFLALFSHTLLTDFVRISPSVWVLVVWVAAITVEEGRQLFARNPVFKEVRLSQQRQSIWRKWKTYSQQNWNQIDLFTIMLFWLGLMVLSSDSHVHIAGRVLLSIDVLFFFMRTFQMLMVFDDLGLLLVMVYKMIKDTRNFMIILLIVVLAYAISSEALLYPDSELTLDRMFNLPRKAYWQVFGDVFLEEIQVRDVGSCSVGNESLHYGGDLPHCPTNYGRYFVPVLLGIYMMITNVLLLNLLIARFGKTFDKVYNEAVEYQAWHRCDMITEFYCRSSLQPPFNLIPVVFRIIRKVLWIICHCCKMCCRCCKRCKARPLGENRASRDRDPLRQKGLYFTRSADRTSLDVFWDQSIASAELGIYTVKVSADGKYSDVFRVAKLKSGLTRGRYTKQALSVWDLDPAKDYMVSLENKDVEERDNTSATRKPENLKDISEFEEKEMRWVMDQEATDTIKDLRVSVSTDLERLREDLKKEVKETTDSLGTELTTVGASLNDNMAKLGPNITDALGESLKKLEDKVAHATVRKAKVIQSLDEMREFLNNTVRAEQSQRTEARVEAAEAKEAADKAKEEADKAKEEASKAKQDLLKVRMDLETTRQDCHAAQQQIVETQGALTRAKENSASRIEEMLMATKSETAMQSEALKAELHTAVSELAGVREMASEARSLASSAKSQLQVMREMLQQILNNQQELQQILSNHQQQLQGLGDPSS